MRFSIRWGLRNLKDGLRRKGYLLMKRYLLKKEKGGKKFRFLKGGSLIRMPYFLFYHIDYILQRIFDAKHILILAFDDGEYERFIKRFKGV